MSGGGLPILTYHAIDATGSVVATARAQFLATLDALEAAGFHPVDLSAWIAQGRPDPEPGRGFAVTFDDGLRSVLDVAGALAERRVPATVFLVTDRMGRDNGWPGQPRAVPGAPLLAWSEVRALAGAGFHFAAHGRTHCRLDRCDDRTLESELRGARDAIEQRLGDSCRLLAYPYGLAPPHVRRAAMRYYDAAFGTRLDFATAQQDPFHLARIDAYYLRSSRLLDRLLCGDAHGWLRMRRIARAVRSACAGGTLAGWTLSAPSRRRESPSLSSAIP